MGIWDQVSSSVSHDPSSADRGQRNGERGLTFKRYRLLRKNFSFYWKDSFFKNFKGNQR